MLLLGRCIELNRKRLVRRLMNMDGWQQLLSDGYSSICVAFRSWRRPAAAAHIPVIGLAREYKKTPNERHATFAQCFPDVFGVNEPWGSMLAAKNNFDRTQEQKMHQQGQRRLLQPALLDWTEVLVWQRRLLQPAHRLASSGVMGFERATQTAAAGRSTSHGTPHRVDQVAIQSIWQYIFPNA
jgi:hypothetical protein